jgi:adenylate kinase
MKTVASCDIVVYDLHDADLEELELVLRVLTSSEITQDMTFILVSSVGVWSRTQRTYETAVQSPEEVVEDPATQEAAVEEAEGDVEKEAPTASGEQAATQSTRRRPIGLRSEDYTRRIPAPKFQDWKNIETLVLSMREKMNVHPYVVCAGIPYGNGEDAFLGLFKAAWQCRQTLRIIGDGYNFLPCVHARDVARLVKHIAVKRPSLEYHLAVDRGDTTQKAIIDAVAAEFGVGHEVQSVSVPEALLAELADILTLDLRLEPSPLMTEMVKVEPPPKEEGETAPVEGEVDEPVPQEKPAFKWWCEDGLVTNISTVASEFARWRRLKPVRCLILGPPGCGASTFAAALAEQYAVEPVVMDNVIENLKNQDSPLGQTVRDTMDQITAALSNPKSTGPFLIPASVTAQVAQEALVERIPVRYRGFTLCGFPTTAEEVDTFFLEDAPVPEPTEETDAPPPEKLPKIFKSSVELDVVIVLSSSDENCQRRAQTEAERPMPDAEFKKKVDVWKKEMPEEGPKLTDALIERGLEPLLFDADVDSPAHVAEQVVLHLETKRQVYNFRLPACKNVSGTNDDETETKPTMDEGSVQKEAENRRKKKEEEDRLEAIKKEEFVRLEKHSEPLRQYLMSFVVPTLTTGLVDVCRETPEDPIAYLADYLSIYSAQLVESRRRRRQQQARPVSPPS